MRMALITIIIFISLFSYILPINIKWEDSDGRKFTLNSHTREFTYSIFYGDKIGDLFKYNTRNSIWDKKNTGPDGTVRKVGGMTLYHDSNGNYRSSSGQIYEIKKKTQQKDNKTKKTKPVRSIA